MHDHEEVYHFVLQDDMIYQDQYTLNRAYLTVTVPPPDVPIAVLPLTE